MKTAEAQAKLIHVFQSCACSVERCFVHRGIPERDRPDLVQSVWLAVHGRLLCGVHPDSKASARDWKAWVLAFAKNTARNYHRKFHPELGNIEGVRCAQTNVERGAEVRERIYRMRSKIDEKSWNIFFCRRILEMTWDAISEEQKITIREAKNTYEKVKKIVEHENAEGGKMRAMCMAMPSLASFCVALLSDGERCESLRRTWIHIQCWFSKELNRASRKEARIAQLEPSRVAQACMWLIAFGSSMVKSSNAETTHGALQSSDSLSLVDTIERGRSAEKQPHIALNIDRVSAFDALQLPISKQSGSIRGPDSLSFQGVTLSQHSRNSQKLATEETKTAFLSTAMTPVDGAPQNDDSENKALKLDYGVEVSAGRSDRMHGKIKTAGRPPIELAAGPMVSANHGSGLAAVEANVSGFGKKISIYVNYANAFESNPDKKTLLRVIVSGVRIHPFAILFEEDKLVSPEAVPQWMEPYVTYLFDSAFVSVSGFAGQRTGGGIGGAFGDQRGVALSGGAEIPIRVTSKVSVGIEFDGGVRYAIKQKPEAYIAYDRNNIFDSDSYVNMGLIVHVRQLY